MVRWMQKLSLAPILMVVLLAIAPVFSAPNVRDAQAGDGDSMAFEPDGGGGGGGNYGDPDDPQSPKVIVGGDPEFSVTDPGAGSIGSGYGGGFGSQRVIGRSTTRWVWHLRYMVAGLRFQILRF